MRSPLIHAIALVAALATARALPAQQADMIRGRVSAPDGKGVENARVTVTSIPGNVPHNAATDRDGRYAVSVASGDGDYWVAVSAIGYAPRRFEVKRLADEAILVGDVRLQVMAVNLEAMRIQADRARPDRAGGAVDVSGTEKSVGSTTADPNDAGNLAAMAASAPGVQLIPGADGAADQFSVFGLGGDQNSTTLNGLGFGGNDIPRDAGTRAGLSTSPWDVSRGGFSGAQLGLSTQAGSNFSSRAMSTLMNAPAAQVVDRAGRALGAAYGALSVGAATAGPVKMDRSFYSIGYQVDRRVSDVPTLANASDLALRMAGVASDSAARLRSLVGLAGAPLSVTGLPAQKVSDRGLLLANFDWAPRGSTTGQALTITAATSIGRSNAPFAQLTALPTNDVRSASWTGALQARQTTYLRNTILSETQAGVSQLRASTTPYLALPSGGVRVTSLFDDGSSAIAGLTFGGSPTQRTSSVTGTASVQNQLSWFSVDNRHRLQLTSSLRYDDVRQDLTSNALGSFAYNSLAELAAGTAAQYTRTLAPRIRSGRQLVGGLAMGDAFRIRPDFQLQYGVRADANRYLRAPQRNENVAAAFGSDNTQLPERLYLSPRVGFAWTYGQSAQLAVAEGYVRSPRAVVRGGFGIFQNTPSAQLVASAISNTGLPQAVSQLVCVGAAVPRADWRAYAAGEGNAPTACADGSAGSSFANSAPDVSLFSTGYAAQRSARSNLNWSGAVLGNRLLATADATYSVNSDQAGVVNLNFAPAVGFRLAAEGNRPVYVTASNVVGATGSIASAAARRDSRFGNVLEQRSAFSSTNRQFTVSLQPATWRARYSWSASYVYSNTRDAQPGFASTGGDPRTNTSARSALDSRHQLSLNGSYDLFGWMPIGFSGSFRSGRPYTPMVNADINGDGFRNDRAYVFDPALSAQDGQVAAGMQALLSGRGAAQRCLVRQLGQVAGRNSCQEPWTSTSTLTIGFNPVKFRFPQRLNASLYVNNPLRWQAVTPDPTLLFVRGFDAASQRFRYEVNPRFGSTNTRESIARNPLVATLQFRYDLGYTRERQLLTQTLDRGRGRTGARSSEQDIRGMSAALIPQNPMGWIMREADTLHLTRVQADSISTLNRVYAVAYDSIWTPVARYLVALPPEYDRAEAYARYRGAREATIDVLRALAPAVRALLSEEQLRRLPATTLTSLDRRYLAAVRSSTAGGASLGALGMLAQMGWNGGTVDPSSSAVMIHR
ncbi:MAG: hypothetical protein JWO05_3700 [Gemmatimonadetes bacterium]|nr:hypothetical protein [Gemmatimonadota bacterium]